MTLGKWRVDAFGCFDFGFDRMKHFGSHMNVLKTAIFSGRQPVVF